MRTPTLMTLVTLLSAMSLAQPVADDEAAFVAELDKAKALSERSRWKDAQATIDKAIAAHDDRNYVRARQGDIAALIKTCVFRTTVEDPDPKDLVSGELLSFTLRTGKIKIRYRKDDLRDWINKSGRSVHPARFAGPHSIEISGKRYPGSGTGAVVDVCLSTDGGHSVVFGRTDLTLGNQTSYVPARIYDLKSGKDTDYKESSSCRPDKKFVLKVTVGKSSVQAAYNGRVVLSGRKRDSDWGYVGFDAGGDFDTVTLTGEAEPAWLQGLMDQATQVQLAAFEATYDGNEHVPAWVFERPRARPALAKAPRGGWPRGVESKHVRGALGRLDALYDREAYEDGEKLAATLRDADASEVGLAWMRALFNLRLGQHEHALGHCDRTLALDPTYCEARVLRARILGASGRHDDAVKAWAELGEEFPGDAELAAERADYLIDSGRFKDARAVVTTALANDLSSEELKAADRLLVIVEQGPRFTRRETITSRNYEVVSDIDRGTCREASRILEESYLAFSTHLERVKDAPAHRFRVFLFAGEGGYLEYCKDLWGVAPGHTAGLYAPRLKQLLIWNLPDRDAMMRTVRHEAFHQYLDRLMPDPPRWFNEGLAEYWETARIVNGTWSIGRPRVDHLTKLKTRIMPLKGFLYRGDREFMIRAGEHYAQSWAFIHFLRHTDTAHKGLFDELWAAFKEGPNARAAMDRVFAQKDMDALERAFAEHVHSLH